MYGSIEKEKKYESNQFVLLTKEVVVFLPFPLLVSDSSPAFYCWLLLRNPYLSLSLSCWGWGAAIFSLLWACFAVVFACGAFS